MCKQNYFHKPFLRIFLVAIVFVFCRDSAKQDKFLFGADVNEAKGGAVSLLEAGKMSFSRVYVPPGRLSDVVRDETRYIPMDATEFEKVVQQLLPRDTSSAFESPQPVAEYVLYEMKLDDSGALLGNVSVRFPGLGAEVEIWPGEAQFQDILWFDEEGSGSKQIDWLQESAERQRRERSFKSDGMPVDLFGKPGGSIDFSSLGAGRLSANLQVPPVRTDRSLNQGVSFSVGRSTFLFRFPD